MATGESKTKKTHATQSRPKKPDPQHTTLLILGASGDLAARLLLPGLGGLLTVERKRRVQLIGAGAETYTAEQWTDRVQTSFDSVEAQTGKKVRGAAVTDLLKHTAYFTADVTDAQALAELLAKCENPPAIYFALPPAITALACEALEKIGLPEGTRLALEKPFGHDQPSAHALNAQVAKLVPEENVFRVDHFLGTSGVLNVLGTRFANRIIEPLLSNEHVASIEIVYDETLGLEGRARYYDHAGALRDMIQSHLLQVMALVVMDAPSGLDAIDVRGHKALVLHATQLWGGDPTTASRRARYTAGKVGRRVLPSYVDEPGVDPAVETETLAELTVEVLTPRWAGVPITLRSGKALATGRHEIVFEFRQPAHVPDGFRGTGRPDRLRLDLKAQTMSIDLNVNGAGDPLTIDAAELTTQLGAGELPAYGEVLDGILTGDAALSVRGDTVEDCWRLVDPVLAAWAAGTVPLEEYPAGSDGPAWRGPDATTP